MKKDNIIYSIMNKNSNEVFVFYEEMLLSGIKVIKSFVWRNMKIPHSANETFLAQINNKIIGTINNFPVKLNYKELIIKACWHTDAIVLNKYRGKGIGTQLMSKSSAKYDLVLQKGISKDMYYISTKNNVGFKDVPYSNYLIFYLKPFNLKKNKTMNIFIKYLFLYKYYYLKFLINNNLKTKIINYFDNTFDQLIKTLPKDELQIQKDSDYLNWRYFNCPLKKYSVIEAYDNKSLRGAIVTTMNDNSRLDIVDLICRTNDQDCIVALIKRLFQEIEHLSINIIYLFATSKNIRRVFQYIGFVESNRSPRFTYWLKNKEMHITFDAIPWNFFSGDGDDEVYMN